MLGLEMTPFLPHSLYPFCLILPHFYTPNICSSFIGALIPYRYDYLLFYLLNTYYRNKQGFTSWIMLISGISWRLFKAWRIQVHQVKRILEEMNIYCQLCPQTLSLQVKRIQRSSSYASCSRLGSAARHYSRVAAIYGVILDLVMLFHYRLMQQNSYILCFCFSTEVTTHGNRATWRS